MFSIVKFRDALRVVREQTDAFVEATKQAFKQTSSFKGELEYNQPKRNCLGDTYAVTFETTLNVEKITATITMFLVAHESLEHFFRLKCIKIRVPELDIDRDVNVSDLGIADEFKIHSVTDREAAKLNIKAKVIPY